MHADTELPEAAEKPPLDQQRRLLPALRNGLCLYMGRPASVCNEEQIQVAEVWCKLTLHGAAFSRLERRLLAEHGSRPR